MTMTLDERITEAMWAGDEDVLNEIAPCDCCCHEHTFAGCKARIWGACRSGLSLGESVDVEERAWAKHYADHHGMSENDFYGYEDED